MRIHHKKYIMGIHQQKVYHGDAPTKSLSWGFTNKKSIMGIHQQKVYHGDSPTKSLSWGFTNKKSIRGIHQPKVYHGHSPTNNYHGDSPTQSLSWGFTNKQLPWGFSNQKLPWGFTNQKLPWGFTNKQLPSGFTNKQLPRGFTNKKLPWGFTNKQSTVNKAAAKSSKARTPCPWAHRRASGAVREPAVLSEGLTQACGTHRLPQFPVGSYGRCMAATQKAGTKMGCPGKWKHGYQNRSFAPPVYF